MGCHIKLERHHQDLFLRGNPTYWKYSKMKIFIFQIISLVIAYGCNDISGPFLQKAKSQCYNQANGKINSNTLKDAVKCCMTNTVGDQRVFGVPLMQFRKLERREENAYRRRLPKGFHSIPNHMFKEESPKCTPRNSNDLRNFFNLIRITFSLTQ